LVNPRVGVEDPPLGVELVELVHPRADVPEIGRPKGAVLGLDADRVPRLRWVDCEADEKGLRVELRSYRLKRALGCDLKVDPEMRLPRPHELVDSAAHRVQPKDLPEAACR